MRVRRSPNSHADRTAGQNEPPSDDRRPHVLELRCVHGTGGGPEKTILAGAATAERVRVSVCYVRSQRDPDYVIDRWARDLGVDYRDVRERHALDPQSWVQVRQIIRRLGVDVVHAHDYKANGLALAMAYAEGIVPLSTAHGWTGHTLRERCLYYPLDRRVLARFPRVIAVSSEIRDTLLRAGTPPSRITVLLNGIDPDAFRRDDRLAARLRQELGLAPEDTVIGAVGRLEPQKNFPLLMRAVHALRARHSRLRLVIVGEGSARASLEQLRTALGLERACHLLGHQRDVKRLHHAFDLFVQSSDYEGTPNAVLEAMAMETPVVATDVGGTSELARSGEHALIVPPRDLEALTAAVTTALDDRDATARRAQSARRRIEHELSFRARTRALEDIYLALARTRARAIPASVA